jgi:hypothetical protein
VIKGKAGEKQMKVQAMWKTTGSGLVFVFRGALVDEVRRAA